MSEQCPEWVATVANGAMLSKAEVCQWMRVTAKDIPALIRGGFPAPRFLGRHAVVGGRIPPNARWMAGDIRKWLGVARKTEGAEVAEAAAPSGSQWQKSHIWQKS